MSTTGEHTRGSWDPTITDAGRRIVPTPQYSNPIAAEIADWLNTCQRTAKALRVYDRNNSMIHQFLDRAMQLLGSIHEKVPEILLTVREDRLRWERDPVLINADRHDGIPFILYRNAFRRLTFERGLSRAELLDFLSAITMDFNAFDQTGEDLLTVLWRLKLAHVRYFTIDALSTVASNGVVPTNEESDEIDRIQGDIDGLVARIYGQTQVDDADLVKGASITREDLEALKEIRQGGDEELEMLDVSTARVIADIPRRDLQQVTSAMAADDRDALVSRLLDVLFHLLFHDSSSVNTGKLLELVQQVFDSILLAGKIAQATDMVQRLRDTEATSEDLQAVHVSRHLLKLLVNETRTGQILAALNDGRHANSPQEVLDLLRTIGPSVTPTLLGMIDTVVLAGNRRLVCDLIVELGMPDGGLILERLQRSSQLVILDLLTIAQRLPRDELAPILLWGVEHETPKVRAFALGLMRPYPAGVADELVVKALRDPDATVRAGAYRLVGQRKHASYRGALEALFKQDDDLWSRDARELTSLMIAYAIVAGEEGVIALDRVLNPGFFARSKMTNGQVAAAVALGRIGSAAAREVLTKGTRTLNAKVREACRRALSRESELEVVGEGEVGLTPAYGTPLPELTPTKERVSDMDLAAELTRGVADPLERARLDRHKPRAVVATPAASRGPSLSRPADGVGVVRRATPTVDHIPERLARTSIKVESSSEPPARRGSRGSGRESSSSGHATVGHDTPSRGSDVVRASVDDLGLEAFARGDSTPPPPRMDAPPARAPRPGSFAAQVVGGPPGTGAPASYAPPTPIHGAPASYAPPTPIQGAPASYAPPTPIQGTPAPHAPPPPMHRVPSAPNAHAAPPAAWAGHAPGAPGGAWPDPSAGLEYDHSQGAQGAPSPNPTAGGWPPPEAAGGWPPQAPTPEPAPGWPPQAPTAGGWPPQAPTPEPAPGWPSPHPSAGAWPSPDAPPSGWPSPGHPAPPELPPGAWPPPPQAPWFGEAPAHPPAPTSGQAPAHAPGQAPAYAPGQAPPRFGTPAPGAAQPSPAHWAPAAPARAPTPAASETPIQVDLAAQTPPSFQHRKAQEFSRDLPTPGQGTPVPIPQYAPDVGGIPPAATPARGVVSDWLAPTRRSTGRSSPYGSASIDPHAALVPAQRPMSPAPGYPPPAVTPAMGYPPPSVTPAMGYPPPAVTPPAGYAAPPPAATSPHGYPPPAATPPPGYGPPPLTPPPGYAAPVASPPPRGIHPPPPAITPVQAHPPPAAITPVQSLPPLPSPESLPGWLGPRSSAAEPPAPGAWAPAPAPRRAPTPLPEVPLALWDGGGAPWPSPVPPPAPQPALPPIPGVFAQPPVLAEHAPYGSGPHSGLSAPAASGSARPSPFTAPVPPPYSAPPPYTPPAAAPPPPDEHGPRPSFADGLEDAFTSPPRLPPSAVPSPPPWLPRVPDRTRDLAPLPATHDSGSHPTWDDEPGDGE